MLRRAAKSLQMNEVGLQQLCGGGPSDQGRRASPAWHSGKPTLGANHRAMNGLHLDENERRQALAGLIALEQRIQAQAEQEPEGRPWAAGM